MSEPGQIDELRAMLRREGLRAGLHTLQEQGNRGAAGALLRGVLVGEGRTEEAAPLLREASHRPGAEGRIAGSMLELAGGRSEAAARLAREALDLEPESPDALLHLARALHNQGRSTEALAQLERAVSLDAGHAVAWHDLGHVRRALGRLPEALRAFRRALECLPGYRSAGMNLGVTLSLLERPDEALDAFQALIGDDPRDVEALVNAGLSLQALGRMDEARDAYERALALDESHAVAWCYLGVLRNEALDTDGALEALQRAVELDPSDVEAWCELANVHEKSNDLEPAASALARAERLAPGHPQVAIDAARLDRRRDRVDEALRRLQAVDARALPQRMAQEYLYEAGTALDRAGREREAFAAFSEANRVAALSPRRRRIDPEAFPRTCEDVAGWLDRDRTVRVREIESEGDLGEDLVFMIGFPRCGTTLLDTILAASDALVTIEERPTVERVLAEMEASGNRLYDDAEPDAETLGKYRRRYREAAADWLEGASAARIVDKLPLRIVHVGLMRKLFPAARYLLSTRHPYDVVLSNFMQNYVPNDAYVHFDSIEETVRTFDRVMNLWAGLRPLVEDRLHEIRYEALVDDPEREIRAACEFLQVPFEETMLDTDRRLGRRGRIRTNSYEQVANRIYKRSVGRSARYAFAFEGVRETLDAQCARLGYEPGPGPD